jgi:hypothetical protein
MRGPLSQEDRDRALQAYLRGIMALEVAAQEMAEEEERKAAEEAIEHLELCLQVIPAQAWPWLWGEAQRALGDAYLRRRAGDGEQNARFAAACYRKALDALLAEVWEFLSTLG